MNKCSVESALKWELSDLYRDLVLLDIISLELQANGHDVKNYRFWLRHSMANTVATLEALNLTKLPNPTEQDTYYTKQDLSEQTTRTISNFKRIYLAYKNEAGSLKESLGIILFYLSLCK
jgi:hypothetical protein